MSIQAKHVPVGSQVVIGLTAVLRCRRARLNLEVMHFDYAPWGREARPGAVACDGLVPGAQLDLSHWSHNRTPAHLKRDTSVEIALAFAEERDRHDVEIITNNHFDADGVLAVWTLLRPELAKKHAELIVAAAECGDFDEWPDDERGMWLESAIASLSAVGGDAAAYARVLPALDELVPAIDRREDLWGDNYRALLARGADLERGAISVERVGRIAVVAHDRGAKEIPGPWLSRSIGMDADRILMAFREGDGWRYTYELRRWSWADTVVRPKPKMPKRGPIRRTMGPAWIIKGRKGMSGLTYTSRPIAEKPRTVAERIAEIDVERFTFSRW
jgi:hypothetical protein